MRIALVSDSPIASLRRPLTECLDAHGIVPRFTVIEDASGDFSGAATHLHEVQPQVTVLYTQAESLVPDLFEVETLTAPVALRRRICDAAVEAMVARVGALRTGTGGTLLVADLAIPFRSPLGIQDTAVEMGLRACIQRINRDVSRRVRRLPRVRLLAFSSVVQNVGSSAVDRSMQNLGGSKWGVGVFRALGAEVSRHLFAMLGRTRTVVVLEGDGVLWGGQAEQRGATGIELSRRDRSRGYIQVQEACLNLRRRGIQLALATRTSKEDVLDAMTQHPQMRLRPDHFAHMEMRWTDKATMLRNVCEALDVCEDKLVYVDSSRSECSWIRSTMGDVEVVSFDNPAELAGILTQHIAFESDRLFLESETPLTHLQPWTTSNSQVGFLEGIEGYLESLETRVRVGMASRFELPKLHTAFRGGEHVELSGRELTASVAHMAAQNPRCMVWWIRLEDRFEDDSVVGLAVFHRGDEVWTLQHFMLASHVMARGVDSVVMANLADVAREEGVNRIEVHCVRRDGNAGVPGSSFEAMGLARTGFSNDGVTYSLPLEGDSQQTLWRPSYVQCKVVEVQEREEEAAA